MHAPVARPVIADRMSPHDQLLQLNVVAVLVDATSDPVPDIERIVGVAWVVRSDRHDLSAESR